MPPPRRVRLRIVVEKCCESFGRSQGLRQYQEFEAGGISCNAQFVYGRMSERGLVSRVSPVQTALRNCSRDEGGPFEFGNQVLISSHRKLLRSKAMVVNVAETLGLDPSRYGRERRAQANRCRS